MADPHTFLDAGAVDAAVSTLRPDYRALLLIVDGVEGGPSTAASDAFLRAAEDHARSLTKNTPIEETAHIAAWREAYRAFGAKPQRTRSSLEALTRRALEGLPRVDRLTDTYNAISVLHQIPLGGEDLDKYVGPPTLTRATGAEPFDTVTGGETAIEYPEPGEVVWTDEMGVTCRRWNWRQGIRTRLTPQTTRALFILDALDPLTDQQLRAAADELQRHLQTANPTALFTRRLLSHR